MKVHILGGDTMGGNPKFVELGGKHIEGMVFATVFVPAASDPRTASFVKNYQAKYNERPDPWAGQFYDAVGLIFEAVKANDYVIDSGKIGEFTRKLNSPQNTYSGIMGNLFFDKTGDGAWSPMIAQIVNSTSAEGDFWKVLSK